MSKWNNKLTNNYFFVSILGYLIIFGRNIGQWLGKPLALLHCIISNSRVIQKFIRTIQIGLAGLLPEVSEILNMVEILGCSEKVEVVGDRTHLTHQNFRKVLKLSMKFDTFGLENYSQLIKMLPKHFRVHKSWFICMFVVWCS